MNATHALGARALCAFALCLVSATAPAGDLTPPSGAVLPAMKTLDEVEPRIPIGPDTTPGDTNSLFKITQPGSYYLTEDVTGRAARHGIEIDSDDVTINLMGYTLRGVADSLDGISFDGSTHKNIRVANGIIRDWEGHGILFIFGANYHIRDVHAYANGLIGIAINGPGVVESCTATTNGQSGISCGGAHTVVRSCTAFQNTELGISIGGGAVLGCTTGMNGTSGIFGGEGAVVADCSTQDNGKYGIHVAVGATVSNCASQSNSDDGIHAGSGSTVSGCSVQGNQSDGIQVPSECFLVENNCQHNGGDPGDGAGIHATGGGNRIEGNHATFNARGLDIDDAGNLVIRNSASGNGVNYDIIAGNTVGPFVNGSNIATNSSPHANYDY